MNNGIIYLKVKLKSLAEEAKIIRKEESKAYGDLLYSLKAHRKHEVRFEARATQIAYAFLRGKPYRQVEPHTPYTSGYYSTQLWARVKKMIEKYGDSHSKPINFVEWSK